MFGCPLDKFNIILDKLAHVFAECQGRAGNQNFELFLPSGKVSGQL